MRHRADVIFMRVGEDKSDQVAYPLLDVAFLFGLNRIILAGGPAECFNGSGPARSAGP